MRVLVLLGLNAGGGCKEDLDDPVNLGVLKRAEKLVDLMHRGLVVRLSPNLNKFGQAFDADEADVASESRSSHLSFQRAGVFTSHDDEG